MQGEGYKNGIFIHSSNINGFAGAISSTNGISTGCLLITPTDWTAFNNVMSGVQNFKVPVSRQVREIVPVQGVNGEVEGVNTFVPVLKQD